MPKITISSRPYATSLNKIKNKIKIKLKRKEIFLTKINYKNKNIKKKNCQKFINAFCCGMVHHPDRLDRKKYLYRAHIKEKNGARNKLKQHPETLRIACSKRIKFLNDSFSDLIFLELFFSLNLNIIISQSI